MIFLWSMIGQTMFTSTCICRVEQGFDWCSQDGSITQQLASFSISDARGEESLMLPEAREKQRCLITKPEFNKISEGYKNKREK